jgi:hypothetical protein
MHGLAYSWLVLFTQMLLSNSLRFGEASTRLHVAAIYLVIAAVCMNVMFVSNSGCRMLQSVAGRDIDTTR